MSHIQIPPGLTELLQGYTVEVLRRQPPDLVDFAVDYFSRLREARCPLSVPTTAAPPSSQSSELFAGPAADAKADSESEDDEILDGRRRAGLRVAAGGPSGLSGAEPSARGWDVGASKWSFSGFPRAPLAHTQPRGARSPECTG